MTLKPPPKKPLTKQDRFAAVARAVLTQLQRHGLGGVTFTHVARLAGVSRPWLYKCVGRRREDLIVFTTGQMGEMVTDHGPPLHGISQKGWFAALETRFGRMLDVVEDFPGIPRLYFQFRGTPNAMGDGLEKIASQIRARETAELIAVFGYSAADAARASEILSALRMGLCFGIAPIALPEFSLKRNVRTLRRAEVLALFGRTLRAVVPPDPA
jgi:AcrR family transcriptional regulator